MARHSLVEPVTPEASRATGQAALSDVHNTVAVPGRNQRVHPLRRLLAFAGPAYLVSVGYMDPGNWATDLEGGSRFGYELLWVLLLSNLLAILLQTLSARLGIVTGKDLAQACRDEYSPPVRNVLWVLSEIAIIACDLAEVLGTALGINLLFGIPLIYGVLITALDAFLLVGLQKLGMRKLEAAVIVIVAIIGVCFCIEVGLSQPSWHSMAAGFIPRLSPDGLFVAIGIIGATVMPHNLYLHSALVQTRRFEQSEEGKRQACTYNFLDSVLALNVAFLINAAILVVAAAVFFARHEVVTEIQQAHKLLTPLLGTSIASTVFGIALLASGQSSTVTGTLAGQIVMEGFLHLKIRPVVRRMLTRSLAIIPAVIVLILFGETSSYRLLLVSQVVLSLQLAFAVVPLIQFTSDKALMGKFVNGKVLILLAWIAAAIVVGLNGKYLWDQFGDGLTSDSSTTRLITQLSLPIALALAIFLLYLIVRPWLIPMRTILRGRLLRAESGLRSTAALLAVHEAAAESPRQRQYHRIGLALDRSEQDIPIVRRAIEMATPIAADPSAELRIFLFHALESASTSLYGNQARDAESRDGEAYLRSLSTTIEQELMRLRGRSHATVAQPASISVEMQLGYGAPSSVLVELARKTKIDLLIMGAHGHRGLKDLIFGATVSPVRHALDIPVLVVKRREK